MVLDVLEGNFEILDDLARSEDSAIEADLEDLEFLLTLRLWESDLGALRGLWWVEHRLRLAEGMTF